MLNEEQRIKEQVDAEMKFQADSGILNQCIVYSGDLSKEQVDQLKANPVENRVIASEPKANGAVAEILPKLEGVSIDEQLATVSNIKECLAVIVNDLETQYYEGNPLPGRKEFLENLINKIYEIATASL